MSAALRVGVRSCVGKRLAPQRAARVCFVCVCVCVCVCVFVFVFVCMHSACVEGEQLVTLLYPLFSLYCEKLRGKCMWMCEAS